MATLIFLAVLLLALTPFMGSAAAQTYPDPHGGFTDYTQFCQICHAVHDAPGVKLERYTPESAVCFTCHNGTGSTYDIRAEMNLDPASNAMHPIIVSLSGNQGNYNYTPNTTAGVAPPGPYDCSQCHDPHGSSPYSNLMKENYDSAEYVEYASSPDPYAACFSCHDSTQILNDETMFKHKLHIVDQKASCSACHFSPHGVPYAKMVRFNPLYVTQSVSAGVGPSYVSAGLNAGSCTLTCHGEEHNNATY